MTQSRRPIAIDLFAGAGGLSLGFEQAGFDVAAAIELDPVHCAIHEFNFPNCAMICADVSKVSARQVRERAGLGTSQIDTVFGGAPCQGFSLIGKRALDDPRNELVSHFVRLVTDLDANYFVFENVKGLTLGPHRKFLEELIAEFENRGYNVRTPIKVLNAVDYGVPQNRYRLFLLGAKNGLTLPNYPFQKDLLFERPSVWDAIGDLPEVENYDILFTSDSVHAKFGNPSTYAQILRGMTEDPQDYSYRRSLTQSLLTSSLRASHTPLSRERFAATEQGKTEPISRFYKLDPNGVCNTLRAGTASDHGAFTSPRPIHPYTPRCITVREAARLHSYPDWFRFHVTKWHGFRQVGNSVPPLLARSVAAEVIASMNVLPIKPKRILNLGNTTTLGISMVQAAFRYGVPVDTIPQRLRTSIASKCSAAA